MVFSRRAGCPAPQEPPARSSSLGRLRSDKARPEVRLVDTWPYYPSPWPNNCRFGLPYNLHGFSNDQDGRRNRIAWQRQSSLQRSSMPASVRLRAFSVTPLRRRPRSRRPCHSSFSHRLTMVPVSPIVHRTRWPGSKRKALAGKASAVFFMASPRVVSGLGHCRGLTWALSDPALCAARNYS
jgi:hypothetical protein